MVVKNKFLKYIKFDTQSNENSDTIPSTVKQFDLAKELKNELENLELTNVKLTDKCYLYATLPANSEKQLPSVGFIAHLDTSPDFSGSNVNPSIIENYDGNDILLNHTENIILSPDEFPDLKKYIGMDLIVSDGKSLLGADDKAGIAEIIAAIEYLLKHPEIKHGPVKIAFTPDEEIGRGADHFDLKYFNADFAYTIDGGELGELQFENFNAASMKVKIKGRNVHPGLAKDKMINSINIAHDFHAQLPREMRPEHTDDYEGFYHLSDFKGQEEESSMVYLIRNHDRERFEQMKQTAIDISNAINKKFKKEIISLEIKDTYYNMHEMIKPHMYIVEIAKNAMLEAGIDPVIKPVRGGTDGARLSYMGLPCPNIFNGGHNAHGRFEFIPVRSMEKASEVIVNIVKYIHNNKL